MLEKLLNKESKDLINPITGKKIEKMSNNIIKKLAIVTISVNLLLLVVIGTMAKGYMYEKDASFLEEKIDNISTTIDTKLEKYSAIAETIASNEEIADLFEMSNKQSPMLSHELSTRIKTYLSKIQLSQEAILNVGVIDLDEDTFFQHDGAVSISGWSFSQRPFYNCITTQKTIITDPYIDLTTNMLVVTIATPVFGSNGNIVGAVFVDITLDFIVQLVATTDFGYSGKSFIADADGNLIACMDFEWIGSHYNNLGDSGADLDRELANTTGSIIEFFAAGTDAIGLVSNIGGTSWKLVTNQSLIEFNQETNNLLSTLIIMLIASIILSIVVVIITIQKNVRPLEYLSLAMRELSKGNTKYEFNYASNNEIGALADDLRSTMQNLSNYITEINRQLTSCGKGDFTVQSKMEFLGDFAEIQISISNFTKLISQTLNDMKSTVEQVTVGSDTVADSSQNIAQGSLEQSNSLRTLNDNISDITTSVSENVKNVQYVNDCSKQASGQLRHSQTKMSQMVTSMEEIIRTSEGIQNIVATIEDVAFQTNILALNASVEAARAGAAGKGFAVVADEVRNLAERTSEAVQETSRLIEETVIAVNSGSDIVGETATGLDEVIEFVSNFMLSLDDITTASMHQSTAIEDINRGVLNITSVMENNSVISEESAATSQELSSHATIMKENIDRFKTLS